MRRKLSDAAAALRRGSALRSAVGCRARVAGARARSRACSAGNGTLIIGTYPDTVLDHRRGDREGRRHDPVQVGHPAPHDAVARSEALLHHRSGMEKVEIIDIAARTTIDTFTLSEGTRRCGSGASSPIRCTASSMMLTASATKLIDRFEIGAPTLCSTT
jgi:hypothetical protein